MTMSALQIVIGLVLLGLGGDLLVRGASAIARRFGISPVVVGITVVSFGTSAPELAVSVQAAFHNQSDVALGNVIGSNIFNVLFILGMCSLLASIPVARALSKRETPTMLAVSLLPFLLGFDGELSRLDGVILTAMVITYTVNLVMRSPRENP